MGSTASPSLTALPGGCPDCDCAAKSAHEQFWTWCSCSCHQPPLSEASFARSMAIVYDDGRRHLRVV